MGLTITINKYDTFDIGYIGFMNFRLKLAEIYNKRLCVHSECNGSVIYEFTKEVLQKISESEA